MGKARGSHGLSAVSLTWATKVLGRLSAHVSPEMLEELAETEGAAELFAERFPGIIADARTAAAEKREKTDKERREELRVHKTTPVGELGLSVLRTELFFAREFGPTVGDLLACTGVPVKAAASFDTITRQGGTAELRERLLEGCVGIDEMPDWLRKAPSASQA